MIRRAGAQAMTEAYEGELEWLRSKIRELDALHVENERLRTALSDMLKHFKQYEDAECCKRVYAQAHRALERKP